MFTIKFFSCARFKIENIEKLVQDSAPFVSNQLLTTYILMSAPLNLAKFSPPPPPPPPPHDPFIERPRGAKKREHRKKKTKNFRPYLPLKFGSEVVNFENWGPR